MEPEMVKAILVGAAAIIVPLVGVLLQYRKVRADLAANTKLTKQVLVTVDGPLKAALERLAVETQRVAELTGKKVDQIKADVAQQAADDHVALDRRQAK